MGLDSMGSNLSSRLSRCFQSSNSAAQGLSFPFLPCRDGTELASLSRCSGIYDGHFYCLHGCSSSCKWFGIPKSVYLHQATIDQPRILPSLADRCSQRDVVWMKAIWSETRRIWQSKRLSLQIILILLCRTFCLMYLFNLSWCHADMFLATI